MSACRAGGEDRVRGSETTASSAHKCPSVHPWIFLEHSLVREIDEFSLTLDTFRFLESHSLVILLPSGSIRVHLIPLQISEECWQSLSIIHKSSPMRNALS